MTDPETLGLRECADRLGVHYMTTYRYVRTGMLPATKVGAEWRVAVSDLDRFRQPAATDTPTDRGGAPWSDRLEARLTAGDERGAWQLVEAALTSGMTPQRVYTEMLGPAMRSIGEGWAAGIRTIADEHRASAVAHRLVGRLGRQFAVRGRPKGRVVIGAPAGERHALPVAMVADLLRGAGLDVVDVGADMPVGDFVEACRAAAPLVAVGVSISDPAAAAEAKRLIEALHTEGLGPVIVGGAAVAKADQAADLGADLHGVDGPAAVAAVMDLIA